MSDEVLVYVTVKFPVDFEHSIVQISYILKYFDNTYAHIKNMPWTIELVSYVRVTKSI